MLLLYINTVVPLILKQLLITGCGLLVNMSDLTFDYKNVTKLAMH